MRRVEGQLRRHWCWNLIVVPRVDLWSWRREIRSALPPKRDRVWKANSSIITSLVLEMNCLSDGINKERAEDIRSTLPPKTTHVLLKSRPSLVRQLMYLPTVDIKSGRRYIRSSLAPKISHVECETRPSLVLEINVRSDGIVSKERADRNGSSLAQNMRHIHGKVDHHWCLKWIYLPTVELSSGRRHPLHFGAKHEKRNRKLERHWCLK